MAYETDDYVDDYEGDIDIENAGYLEDFESDDVDFEEEYDKIFGSEEDENVSYDRDAITGRRAKRPKMAALNKSSLSKSEMDELFLD